MMVQSSDILCFHVNHSSAVIATAAAARTNMDAPAAWQIHSDAAAVATVLHNCLSRASQPHHRHLETHLGAPTTRVTST
jgi:hypothetical protein